MAALLESLLLQKVDLKKVVDWLKNAEGCLSFQQEGDKLSFSEPGVTVHKQEFVPFLLNFLREQSSQALTHGPATPAKTPSRPRSAPQTQGLSDRRGCRSAGGQVGSRSASRVQLFSTSVSPGTEYDAASQSGSHCLSGVSAFSSPSFSTTWSPASRPSGSERRPGQRISLGDYMVSPPDLQHSPNFQSQKSRRKSGQHSMAVGGQGKHGGGRGGHHSEETGRWEAGGRKSAKGGGGYGRIIEQISPPSVNQLNFNNLEDFPPVGSSPFSPAASKPTRRINPTPVSTERPHSKPKTCFTSTPFSKPTSPPSGVEALEGSMTVGSPLSLQEERELLKREKTKRAQQVGSPLPSSLDPCTPTKTGLRIGSKVTPDLQTTCPEPSKVTFSLDLDLLAELYCTCISENLVPNIFLELFFVMQLLTSRSPHNHDDEEQESLHATNSDVLEKCYLRQVHNCVYFAVKVLENQFQLVAHLDKCTLRLLAENERVASFSPDLRDRLTQAQDRSTAKLSPSGSTFIHSVPFQPATDNRSNFGSDKAFHTFKKQRDIFYEVLREWEDFHKEPGWNFDAALGSRIRGMMGQLTSAGNHSHFARLFLKQLVQMCKGTRVNSSPGDTPDADLLGMLGADSLGRLKRLEERLIQPHGVAGPCPPPSFPGHQEFFRDFLQAASCCQLNQHLQDSLCQQLLQLDEVSILSPPASIGEGEEEEDGDMEQQDEKQRFSSVLLLARLLAKFLGLISFLPYQTSEKPSREIQETAITLRSKSVPVLDVCAVLSNSVRRRRTILTVPWLVEFLSMLDFVGPRLLCYRTALGTLLLLYRRMLLGRCEEICYLNKLLMVSVLGWLFQIPVIPEDIFFTSEFTEVAQIEDSNSSTAGLDCIPLVDQQLLYTCCPFLGEFRKLLAAFVSGSTAKGGGIIRKITPTSAELKDAQAANRSQQKLQMDLEQAFFHNQPPSLRRTVEFVAERVGSNAVKHMKATLVSELVEKGEKMLRDGLTSPNSNPSKLNDAICAQLCEAGLEALSRATRFCYEKSPEAIRTLLPDETSPPVLTTSENITKRLATEKACSWLSANITALVRREWKSRYDRVMKALSSPVAPDSADVDRAVVELVTQEQSTTPKRTQGSESERVTSCPPHCNHSASRPSDILIEMKELLSIAVGPRTDEELPTVSELQTLLQRVGGTLACRKFLTVLSEQMLWNSTVLLACKLVSAELPVLPPSGCSRPGGVVVGPDSGSELRVTALLEELAELWQKDCCSSAPLHLLFTPITVTAVLKASDTEWKNYLFLVRKLVDRGVLSEEEVISHWKKLTDLALPAELIENFQLQSASVKPSLPLAERQSHMDMLQVSHQTVEGAT
ncbi:codanin-1 isoform X1 [Amphiprion ocellaris]|uniref:Codanin-1 C-terminal domain-containing protein n=1 Tax=Amphiprion ocellaris TaxID=80972 RepID=A0A3Q1BK14_AMPOC|nr:codanin-1 isoform X1 [Amphiprion ocellaris]